MGTKLLSTQIFLQMVDWFRWKARKTNNDHPTAYPGYDWLKAQTKISHFIEIMDQIKLQHPDYSKAVLIGKAMDYMKAQLLAAQQITSSSWPIYTFQWSCTGEAQPYEENEDEPTIYNR